MEDENDHIPEGDVYHITWVVLYAILFFPIVFGNVMILLSMKKCRLLRNRTYILIGNLALSDLFAGVFLVPVAILTLLKPNLLQIKVWCLLKLSLLTISLGLTVFGLLLISVERFIAVAFPFQHRAFVTRTKLLVAATIGWVGNVAISLSPVYGWNTFKGGKEEECTTDSVWPHTYETLMNWCFITIVGTTVILYIIVVRIALKHLNPTSDNTESESQDSGTTRTNTNIVRTDKKRDFKKTKLMLLVFAIFAACWFPYIALVIAIQLHDVPELRKARSWCLMLGMANSGVNWIIYGVRNSKFRKAFKAVICCRRVETTKLRPRSTYS